MLGVVMVGADGSKPRKHLHANMHTESMAVDATSVDAAWSDVAAHAMSAWSNGASHGTTSRNDGATRPLDDGSTDAVDDGWTIPRTMDSSTATHGRTYQKCR
jgi:hypothetical protein